SSCPAADRVRPSCPTRRSSDLFDRTDATDHVTSPPAAVSRTRHRVGRPAARTSRQPPSSTVSLPGPPALGFFPGGASSGGGVGRSEEHTSELQSRENLVCRLLL